MSLELEPMWTPNAPLWTFHRCESTSQIENDRSLSAKLSTAFSAFASTFVLTKPLIFIRG
eukprot:NODE_27810_length_500_cov_0.989276.p3 GENE.NODE_27810_length_500_cov_0.989276~~NODE_27810_length_500_cov_0.989276.p3  ORF type:complete len:60 (-),score=9.68 NODE_27810_length_500_cov_0.989276:125-304(-)